MIAAILVILSISLMLPRTSWEMQEHYTNQWLDVYSWGLGSACILGYLISYFINLDARLSVLLFGSMWTLLCSFLASSLKGYDMHTFGMVGGVCLGAVGTTICVNIQPDQLATYYQWCNPDFSNVDLVSAGLMFAVSLVSTFMLHCTSSFTMRYFELSFISVLLIALFGPIWTISLLAPNLSRYLKNSSVAVFFVSTFLLTVSFLISHYAPFNLPLSSVLAFLSLPTYFLCKAQSH